MVCSPNGLALDASGNLIVADGGNSRIRRISTAGKITTIAGDGTYGYGGDGGPATSASIGQPYDLAYDAAGNLYFAQVGNCVVRKIDTGGTITTLAGTGTCGYNGEGTATTAQLNLPRGVAVDSSGNVYIGDTLNHRVRKVSAGIISTFAGTGNPGYSGDGGPATSANIGNPHGLAIRNGVLYISNAGRQRFRSVDLTSNIINTYAGSFFGYDGDNHSLLATQFAGAAFILFDSAGNPLFDDSINGRVRKATGGIVNTIAGGYLGDGLSATSAALVLPEALAIDKSGNEYIADYAGNRVRKVSAGKISTVAGTGVNGYSGDGGLATTALLNAPQGIALDSAGNVFIADSNNNVIREVNTAGNISTFATNPNFNYLLQMATDAANNLYVADNGACVVWKITPVGVVSIVAGVLNTCGYNGDGIAAKTAQMNGPYSVAVDASGNLFIADSGNNRVRHVNTSGMMGTVAGDGNCGYSGDGGSATTAEICFPYGVAVSKSGAIYLSDVNLRVRKISGGTITAFAGAGFGFNGDGLWPQLTAFDDPVAVALDSKGAVYVLDDWDHRVRKIQ
jgi:sugar lactone lactonase YvrE